MVEIDDQRPSIGQVAPAFPDFRRDRLCFQLIFVDDEIVIVGEAPCPLVRVIVTRPGVRPPGDDNLFASFGL